METEEYADWIETNKPLCDQLELPQSMLCRAVDHLVTYAIARVQNAILKPGASAPPTLGTGRLKLEDVKKFRAKPRLRGESLAVQAREGQAATIQDSRNDAEVDAALVAALGGQAEATPAEEERGTPPGTPSPRRREPTSKPKRATSKSVKRIEADLSDL